MLRFLVIDATKNDLNWEFTALSYPSVLFFPKNRSVPTNLCYFYTRVFHYVKNRKLEEKLMAKVIILIIRK